MNSLSDLSPITYLLSDWYKKHKRELPWRLSSDPYPIWLSEIILQQTRVEQGLPYFNAILKRFPNVESMAKAPLDDLLKLWQGLGYYSRARNMHTAAQQVFHDFGGTFPSTYEELLHLKGIGEYTAAAIASIAYGAPKAVVDGNVFRVLARIFAIDTPINTTEGKKLFSGLAEELLDKKQPSQHNQAMMDFGAMQCTPSSPDCSICPLKEHCQAFATGHISEFPVKLPGAAKQNRYFNYLFLSDGENTWLQQRLQKDIWQNLWEFPLLETIKEETVEDLLRRADVSAWIGSSFVLGTPVRLKHVLSHRVIHATFIPVRIVKAGVFPEQWKKIALKTLNLFAVSRMMESFMEKNVPMYY
jgi:A/G-specific adenine glycosylase